jgi:hypothetical protein
MAIVRKVLWRKVACQRLGCPRQVLFTMGFCIDFNLLIHQVDNPHFWNTVRSMVAQHSTACHYPKFSLGNTSLRIQAAVSVMVP